MSNPKKRPLTQLIIRFPDRIYKALKVKAEATSVPMVNLVCPNVASERRPSRRSRRRRRELASHDQLVVDDYAVQSRPSSIHSRISA